MFSRTRVFGIALVLYSLLATGFIYLDLVNHNIEVNENRLIFFGGLLLFVAGIVIAAREKFDKMYAIGLYAVTFGIYKILKAYSMMTIDVTHFNIQDVHLVDVVAVVMIVFSVSLILLGISFLLGTAKNIWRKVLVSLILIMMSTMGFFGYFVIGDMLMAATEAVEIVLLLFFISLLLSRDVRSNTVEAKQENAKRIAKNAKKDAKAKYKQEIEAADAMERSGDKKAAKRMREEAKKAYKRRIAEGKHVTDNAEKNRYYYNESSGKVEVKK